MIIAPHEHQAQSLARLRMRYPWAVDHAHDVLAIQRGRELHPGLDRTHLFEFANGLRLTVFIETRADLGQTVLALAASVASLTRLSAEIIEGRMPPDGLLRLAESAYQDLSHAPRKPRFVGFTSHQVPYWMAEVPVPGSA